MARKTYKTYRRRARISDQPPHRQRRGPNRFPPVGGKYVVLIQQVAQALGWSTARVRSVDDVLKPIRMADGARAYDVDRALFFIRIFDTLDAITRAREAKERARLRRLARLGKLPASRIDDEAAGSWCREVTAGPVAKGSRGSRGSRPEAT